jgi:glycosyltransferase involved in cell wall biosynthesis
MLLVIIFWFVGWILFFKPRVIPFNLKCRVDTDISVIIPARNEEENIGKLLKSLKEQTQKISEIIVVDDNSSDRTAEIAKEMGGKVIKLREEPPPGWLGKAWACWNGFLQSRGRVIIFLDADVTLSFDAIRSLVCLQREKKGLISVWPYHQIGNFSESLSLFFNLIALFPMRISGIFKNIFKPMGAFGPCIVTTREDYHRTGGHMSVRGSVVEDVMLGKIYLKNGIPVYNFLGWKMVSFRMYPKGIHSIVEGWGKNIAMGLSLLDFVSFILLFLWITGAISAGFFLNSRSTGFFRSLILYFLYSFQIFLLSKKIGSFSLISSFLFPLHFIFFLFIFFFSFFQTYILKRVIWKGRRVRIG